MEAVVLGNTLTNTLGLLPEWCVYLHCVEHSSTVSIGWLLHASQAPLLFH
jgi:hypothetical protein